MNPNIVLFCEAVRPTAEHQQLFPFPFWIHIAFCCLAVIILTIQYKRLKKPYLAVFLAAIPISLLIWLTENKFFFKIIGFLELALMVLAMILSIVFKDKRKPEKESVQTDASDSDSDDDSEDESDENIISEESNTEQ